MLLTVQALVGKRRGTVQGDEIFSEPALLFLSQLNHAPKTTRRAKNG
jgi:hypothetical protein